MNGKMCILLVAAGSLIWNASAEALPIAISSMMQLRAGSRIGATTITDTDTDSQGGTLNSLSASVSALATSGAASVLTTGEGSATWVDASQGSVNFSNIGWDTQNITDGASRVLELKGWSYTFVADATGLFTLDFNTLASGSSLFGLNYFHFFWSGDGGNSTMGLNTSGTITRSIIAGNTYTVGIHNQANIGGYLGTRDAHMSGAFDWHMDTATPVPEPSTWMLLSLGMLGFAIFRHRCSRTVAQN